MGTILLRSYPPMKPSWWDGQAACAVGMAEGEREGEDGLAEADGGNWHACAVRACVCVLRWPTYLCCGGGACKSNRSSSGSSSPHGPSSSLGRGGGRDTDSQFDSAHYTHCLSPNVSRGRIPTTRVCLSGARSQVFVAAFGRHAARQGGREEVTLSATSRCLLRR